MRHHRHQFRPCVSRLRPSRVPQHREGSIHAPLLCLLEVGLASQRPFKHRLPVPILRGQTKQAVQPHVVQDQAVALPVKDAHAPPHLLQVFCQRQRRPRQLNKLHVGTVEALAEEVHVHQHLRLSCLELFNQPTTFLPWCLRADRHRVNTVFPIVRSDMLRMPNVNRIDDALLIPRITQHRVAEPPDTRPHVQPFAHLPQREVAIGPTSLQRPHHPPVLVVRPHRHIVVERQTALGDKAIVRPRLQQHLEEVRESPTRQSAGRGRQSQHLRPGTSLHHRLVRLRHGMVGLIDHQQARPLRQFPFVPRQPLDGKDPYPVAHEILLLQRPDDLFHQFPAVHHDPHRPLVLRQPRAHTRHQHARLSRTRRHLHHHGPVRPKGLTHPPFHIKLIIVKLPLLHTILL